MYITEQHSHRVVLDDNVQYVINYGHKNCFCVIVSKTSIKNLHTITTSVTGRDIAKLSL